MNNINEIKYFKHTDLCDCIPNEDNTKCKIFSEGNVESIHCKVNNNIIKNKCPPLNKNCSLFASRKFMTIPNTSSISDIEAKSKCMFPFIYDRRDENKNIQCAILPEPYMQEFTQNNTKYLGISKDIYNTLESKYTNFENNALMSCVNNLANIEGNVINCYNTTLQQCKETSTKENIADCTIKTFRNNCLKKSLFNKPDEFEQCLVNFKNNFDEQKQCPPGKQNYTLFDCIPNDYNYQDTTKEILDRKMIKTNMDYITTKCKPSITKNGKTYNYFDESFDECFYAHSYKVDIKNNLPANYCTNGFPLYQNRCSTLLKPQPQGNNPDNYSPNGYVMKNCKITNALDIFNSDNSKVDCIQTCPDGYAMDNNNKTNGNNCVQIVSERKVINKLEKNPIDLEWYNYCNINANIESDKCIKTINITPDKKQAIGTKKCIQNIEELDTLVVSYDVVANHCDDLKKIYNINRPVYISNKYVDKDLSVKTKDKLVFEDYIKKCNSSNIYIDLFLIDAIKNGEFKYNLIPKICVSSSDNKIIGYTLQIQRLMFGGSPEQCCDNNGINYYNSLLNDRVNSNFKNRIFTKDNIKSTCNINYAKLNNKCSDLTGNLEGLKICLKNNPDICPEFNGNVNNPDLISCLEDNKTICQKQLIDYCSSGGINIWGDGIPRIIDVDEKANLKYPRCGIDFQKKYPEDYNQVLESICNRYDNRDNLGYTYYRTNPICRNYCRNKERTQFIDKCIGDCFGNVTASEEYQINFNNKLKKICPSTETEPKGNIDCINRNTPIIASELETSTTRQCQRDCERSARSIEFDGCNMGKENYCLNYDYDFKGNKIGRFFTSECQKVFEDKKQFGLIVEGVCVMNRNNTLYNYPECEQFRNEHQTCIMDNKLNNNSVFSEGCYDFCQKYKSTCDAKKRDVCKQNPFLPECDDDNFEDYNDLDPSKKTYKKSLNKRLATENAQQFDEIEDNRKLNLKKYMDLKGNNKINEFREQYILDFCLSSNRNTNSKCEEYIKKIFNDKKIIDTCISDKNYLTNPLCKKLEKMRNEEFVNAVKDTCITPMKEYAQKCGDIKDANERAQCRKQEKTKYFYNTTTCQEIRNEKNTNQYLKMFSGIIAGIIVVLIIMKLIQFLRK